MENHTPFGFGKNIFTKAFQEFDENSFFENLEERVVPKSYYQRNKDLKNTVLLLSYLFNLVSMLTASYLVFSLVHWLTGITLAAYSLAGLFLFFLEKLKRKSSSEFFQVWFFQKKIAVGWLVLSAGLLIISVASTFFGTTQATQDFAPDAPIILHDSTITSSRQELALLRGENEKLEQRVNSEGIIYWTAQKSIQANTERMKDIQSLLNSKEIRKAQKNDIIEENHFTHVQLTSATLAWITVILELLFESCIAYIWYFYYRSYVERKLINQKYSFSPPPTSESLLDRKDEDVYSKIIENDINNTNIYTPKNGNLNGKSIHSLEKKSEITPIVFFPTKTQSSYDALQHVIRDENPSIDDLHTIAHKDSRTGETKRYTLNRVDNFIGHYAKAIDEAVNNGMAISVLANRKKWLKYWQEKKTELLLKQEKYNISL